VTTPAVPPTSRRVRLKPLTIVPVWAFTLVVAVVVSVAAPGDDFYVWLPLVLATSIILSFVLQLAASEKDGLVSRTVLSLCGSLVILAVTTGVLELVR